VVKFYVACNIGRLQEYFDWILIDIAVLLSIELILALVCFIWPRKVVIRIALLVAAVVCTWSVINAGWLIATGTQVLPAVVLPLLHDPLNRLAIVGYHLMIRPVAATALLVPSAIALAFFFAVLARPLLPVHNKKVFRNRVIACVILIIAAGALGSSTPKHKSLELTSEGLRYNSQIKAVENLFSSRAKQTVKIDLEKAKRKVTAFDEIEIPISDGKAAQPYNVVVIVLEGVQYRYTSLYQKKPELTPKLAALAEAGVQFSNVRTSVTHTTKALFSLLTGRYPSVSQDIIEAVPVDKPYASLATVLKSQAHYRTAFFQSAKGNFECRPGLVHNLGFEKFWARDDLSDRQAYLGYLASDEFAMLKPIARWITAENRPFFLTVLCSVTHDPYEIPERFGSVAQEPVARYQQTIAYTDKFLAAFDAMLEKLDLVDNTIFCVIGDHGEAFGEHNLFGHARIPFEEALRIVWVMRAGSLIQPGLKVTEAASSVDLTPTLLALLGFDVNKADFDGINVLGSLPANRKLYFSCWIPQGPSGFILGDYKYVCNPTLGLIFCYDLKEDPNELARKELVLEQADKTARDVLRWRQQSVFNPRQVPLGKRLLFDRWLCRWNKCQASASYTKLVAREP